MPPRSPKYWRKSPDETCGSSRGWGSSSIQPMSPRHGRSERSKTAGNKGSELQNGCLPPIGRKLMGGLPERRRRVRNTLPPVRCARPSRPDRSHLRGHRHPGLDIGREDRRRAWEPSIANRLPTSRRPDIARKSSTGIRGEKPTPVRYTSGTTALPAGIPPSRLISTSTLDNARLQDHQAAGASIDALYLALLSPRYQRDTVYFRSSTASSAGTSTSTQVIGLLSIHVPVLA